MKKLLILLLLICHSFLFAQASYFEVPLGAKEKVLASVLTPDNQYYVATGTKDKYNPSDYDATKGVTITHFGEDMKFISKVKTKPIKNGKEYFHVVSMIALGDSIAFVGTTVNYKLSTESTGLVVIDKKTLMPEKKISQIHAHPVRLMLGFSPDKTNIEFKQATSGETAAFFFEYTEDQETKPGSWITTQAYEIILVQRNLNTSKIFSFSARDDKKNYQVNDYFITKNGDLYLSMNYMTMPPEPKTEMWWDDKDYVKAVGESPWHSMIYHYRNKSVISEATVTFENQELLVSSVYFYETENMGMYFGGMATNQEYNSKRYLREDTLNMSDLVKVFFGIKLAEGKEQAIAEKSCFVISGKTEKKLLEERSLSEKDKELGAEESIHLISFSVNNEGRMLFTGAKLTYHIYPLYETIKDNKNYTFVKDDNGKITDIEGSMDLFMLYHNLFTIQFSADFTSPEIELTDFHGKQQYGFGEGASLLDYVYTRASDLMPHFYYSNTPCDGNIYHWNGNGEATTLNIHPKGAAYIQRPTSVNGAMSRFTIVDENKFWVVKGE